VCLTDPHTREIRRQIERRPVNTHVRVGIGSLRLKRERERERERDEKEGERDGEGERAGKRQRKRENVRIFENPTRVFSSLYLSLSLAASLSL
jgi:hypothetical protein